MGWGEKQRENASRAWMGRERATQEGGPPEDAQPASPPQKGPIGSGDEAKSVETSRLPPPQVLPSSPATMKRVILIHRQARARFKTKNNTINRLFQFILKRPDPSIRRSEGPFLQLSPLRDLPERRKGVGSARWNTKRMSCIKFF